MQQKLLLLYSTQDGQTRKIIEFLTTQLQQQGWLCQVHNLADNPPSPIGFTGVILASAIRYGHFHQAFRQYVKQYNEVLTKQWSAFIAVNLTARKPDKATPKTNPYTRKFLARSEWQPDLCLVVAGALRYSYYHWLDRLMIRLIMQITGGETDPRANIEYTNWDQVGVFARQIAQQFVKTK